MEGEKLKKQVQAKTLEIRKDVAKRLVKGYTFNSLRKYIQDKYGYTERASEKVIKNTNADLRKHYEDYMNNIAAFNLSRLTEIVNDCQEKGKYSDALKAIDILNKMSNLYTQKIEVKTEEPIEINLV